MTLDTPSSPLVDLHACIAELERTDRLVRVRSEVDPKHELAGVARRFEGGKSVLFERVKGSDHPVLIGLLWNRETVGRLFGQAPSDLPFVIAGAVEPWLADKQAMPARLLDQGPANEVVDDVDLFRLPIPVHALLDGGRYLDSSLVMVRNPETGGLNISVHRMMVTDKDRLTFLIDPGRHLGDYLAAAEKRGEPLPVTINNGIGLAPWFVAALPRLGDGKHVIAHHLAGQPIELVRARTVDVPAYAHAQFVIEAEILPSEREDEGPFAEVTGYYGGLDKRWVMRVKAITRRRHPVFHTVLSGQEVWNTVGFTAEAAIYRALKKRFAAVQAVFLPPGGCGFYQAVVQVGEAGIGREVIRATFDAFRSLQRVTVVDTDVNIHDPIDVEWAVTTRCDPERGLIVLRAEEGHPLNPLVKNGRVTKVGMDATVPPGEKEKFERVRFQEVDLGDHDIAGL